MELILIPDIVKIVLTGINKLGYSAYLVGGAVRDMIIGIPNKDYDICTNMPLEDIKKLLPDFYIMKENDHRNTGIINFRNAIIEISSFKGNTLEEDLAHRDFTINAIAMDAASNIIDPFKGQKDIEQKRIVLTNSSGIGFVQDPLRILRAIRLASKLDFTIDSNCQKQMLRKKELLSYVKIERIYEELKKILLLDKPSIYFDKYKEIFFEIIPELKPMDNFEQFNPHHTYNVWEHTLKVLDNTEPNLSLRLAALFHDSGKPASFFTDDKGVGHFYGHPLASDKIFKEVAKRLKIDHKTRDLTSKLIVYHDDILGIKSKSVKKFLYRYGIDDVDLLFKLKEADIKGQNPEMMNERLQELQNIEEIYTNYLNSEPCLTVKNLKINGHKLYEMGFRDKMIGNVLNDVLMQVIDGNIDNNESDIENYIGQKYI